MKSKIIGEVGSNYDGSFDQALRYIKEVAATGADVAKFQLLRKDLLVAPRLYPGGKATDNPVYANFSNLELPEEWVPELVAACQEHEIAFSCTPFYLEAVSVLERAGVEDYKIASGDITFTPLLERVGETGKPVLLSTGGSSLEDVEKALKTLKKSGAGPVTLLHCVVSYPPQWEEVNLNAMLTLKKEFSCPVGLSDHTPGGVVALGAVALGASVIEKHVTHDRSAVGPDHPFAMTFPEFGEMVKQIRLLEQSLGDGNKTPTASERDRQHRFRRGCYDPETRSPSGATREGLWLRPQADTVSAS